MREYILREAEKRIRYLIPFDASAFYLIDQDQSDFIFSLCEPSEKKQFIEDQVGYMIEKGFFAWAIRERRGITISSHDHSRRMMLHVIATSSRIRGMFVGLLPDKERYHSRQIDDPFIIHSAEYGQCRGKP